MEELLEILNESFRRKSWYFEKNSSAVLTYRRNTIGLVIPISMNLKNASQIVIIVLMELMDQLVQFAALDLE